MWRIQPVDAVTFQPVMAPLDASDVTWERALNRVGSASFTVQTKAANSDWTAAWWRRLDTAWRTILVLEWVRPNGIRYPIYAGWVTGREAWNPRTGEATWGTRDGRAWLSRRFVYPAKYRNESWFARRWRPIAAAAEVTAAAAAGAVIRASMGTANAVDISTGQEWARWDRTTDPRYVIPLTTEVDSGGSSPQEFWWWARERHAEGLITDLQERDDGPDIDFQPVWESDGSLAFWVPVKSPILRRWTRRLSADMHPGAESSLLDLQIVSDGLETATSMTGLGAGQGSDMELVTVFETDVPGYVTNTPQRERIYDAKQAEEGPSLRAQTRGSLVNAREAATAWSFSIVTEGVAEYDIPDFLPGVILQVDYPGDLLEPAGVREFQIVRVAGDLSQKLTLEVQEV